MSDFKSDFEKSANTKNTNSAAIPQREATLRETITSAMIGTPDKEDISKLIVGRDRSGNQMIFESSDTYYSPDASYEDKYQREKSLSSTAFLLDRALQKADPATKQNLVDDAVKQAGKLDETNQVRGSASNSPNSRYDDITQYANHIAEKLEVLARHGGDMNDAIQAADDAKVITRNAKILVDSGQTFSQKSVDHLANSHVSADDLEKNGALNSFLRATDGKMLPAPITATGEYPLKRVTSNPLAIALIKDPEANLFDDLLAKDGKGGGTGPYGGSAELYKAAIISKQPEAAIRKLNAYGFDINAKDNVGRTAAEYVEMNDYSTYALQNAEMRKSIYGYLKENGAGGAQLEQAEARNNKVIDAENAVTAKYNEAKQFSSDTRSDIKRGEAVNTQTYNSSSPKL